MPQVRPAEASDAPGIVEILRSGFPRKLLPYTVFGCDGVERYVRDSINHQDVGASVWYVIESARCPAAGFAEVRRSDRSLFLNHLFIVPSARGPGIGPGFMFHAVSLARNLGQSRVELDVFHDNYTVRRGHRALGFREVFEHLWAEVSLHDWVGPGNDDWHAGNLAQADRIHQEYGFSQFDLHTASGSYRTGRLGARLFRATDAAVLSDPCVPHALQMLDPHRSLLCIDTKDRLCDVLPPGASVLARSFRMSNDVDHLLERLSGFRRF